MLVAAATMAVVLQAPSDAAPVRLEPGMVQPRVLKAAHPEHPAEARKVGLQGAVAVGVTVDRDGRVVEAVALQGDAPLTAAAVKAVKKWRYEPLVLDGSPRAFTSTVRVNFILERPTMWFGDLIEGLSSPYMAVRECAAERLGRMFNHHRPSSESRRAAGELRSLLKREQDSRVRKTVEFALAGFEE